MINLRNINRVMGEALLVNFNAYAISQAGLDAGATTHAQQVNTAANNLWIRLFHTTQLRTSPQVQSYFSSTSNKQPTTQYGNTNLSPSANPTFSYVNRQTASNVFIAPQQIADYTTNTSALYNSRLASGVTTVSSDSAHNYVKGYLDGLSPVAANPSFQDVHFMPLKPGDRPHLVSQAQFNQNAVANQGTNPFNWATPVPDSLSIAATDKANDGGYTGGSTPLP